MITPKGDPFIGRRGGDKFAVVCLASRGLYMLEEARASVKLRTACFAIGGDNLGSDVVDVSVHMPVVCGKS